MSAFGKRVSSVAVPPNSNTATTSRRFSIFVPRRHAARRSQNFNSGFTSSYDPTLEEGRGPMFRQSSYSGVPQFYPHQLKARVDQFVVGQDRAKKTICTTLFNHYQNRRRREHQDHAERLRKEKQLRQQQTREREQSERMGAHQVDDEFPGHAESVFQSTRNQDASSSVDNTDDFLSTEDHSGNALHVKIDKSNLLLIGPTGVGKTYILETLGKMLKVPFTVADCNSFTQAGYVGQDVETCIERLLIKADYDVKAAESGIVVLDEFDKLARRESMNGRDVGGEGVQQALLKLVEGTNVTINVKDNRSSRSAAPITTSYTPTGPSTSATQSSSTQRVDQYTVDTTNILFVLCGAFVGLEKIILRRVSRPAMGFGSELRSTPGLGGLKHSLPKAMFAHLPHIDPDADASAYSPLDLTTPADLQAFGFIPELIGRVHNICALSPLSPTDLRRILTEPRDSPVAQYTAQFEGYPSRLFFTNRALQAIAENAAKSETGARGLRMEMERVLAHPMYHAGVAYVLITEGCVNGTEAARYWGKDGRMELERTMRDEDGECREEEPQFARQSMSSTG